MDHPEQLNEPSNLNPSQAEHTPAFMRIFSVLVGFMVVNALVWPLGANAQAAGDAQKGPTRSSGSGFSVSNDGHVLTNAHVVESCDEVQVSSITLGPTLGRIIARDVRNDLALLKMDVPTRPALFRRSTIRSGDSVIALGFPLRGLLADDVNVSVGIVSAMAGMRNDTSHLQISAPVQPGNSGGPLLDTSGAVAGVVVAKLNALAVARVVGDVPQNINFAIKGEIAQSFLQSNGVDPRLHPPMTRQIDVAEAVRTARQFTYLISCDPGRLAKTKAEAAARAESIRKAEEERADAERKAESKQREAARKDEEAKLAAEFRVGWPINCNYGVDCFVQNYFDRDSTSGRQDFACGHLSYDGYSGTGIRLLSLKDLDRNVEVRAAATGVVAGTRDGEPDISFEKRGEEAVRGKPAGNGVVINHPGGWQTQYSHLKSGSVKVRIGQRVEEGEPLGYVGLSGRTNFPHLSFSVRRNGIPVDPFAPDPQVPCGQPSRSLWKPEISDRLPYIPIGVLIAGWSDKEPDRERAQSGEYVGELDRKSDAIAFYIEIFGIRKGDTHKMEIFSPAGINIASKEITADNNFASYFSTLGKRRLLSSQWEPGKYVARVWVVRSGDTVLSLSRELELR